MPSSLRCQSGPKSHRCQIPPSEILLPPLHRVNLQTSARKYAPEAARMGYIVANPLFQTGVGHAHHHLNMPRGKSMGRPLRKVPMRRFLQADLHRLPGESDRGGGNSVFLTTITTLIWPNRAKAFRLNIPLNNLSFAHAKTNSLNMFVGNPGWIRYFCIADSGVLRQIPEYCGGIRKTSRYGRLSPPDAA